MDQDAVCRNPVPFGQQDDIPADNFPSGDADFFALPDDIGTGAGQIFQGFQGPFGFFLLVKGDADDDKDKAQQHEGFLEFAGQQIKGAAGDQKKEHGFFQDPDEDIQAVSPAMARQFIQPVLLPLPEDLTLCQACQFFICDSSHSLSYVLLGNFYIVIIKITLFSGRVTGGTVGK